MEFSGTSDYVSTLDLTVAVNASINLERPLLVKGEPGTGKTELARQVANSLKLEIIEWNMLCRHVVGCYTVCTHREICRSAGEKNTHFGNKPNPREKKNLELDYKVIM